MKITLISPYSVVSATGIRWLSGYLKSRGNITQLIFLPDQAEEPYSSEILEEVSNLCRDSRVVGISLTSNLVPQARQLTHKVKETVPDIVVVWGGPHPSFRPEDSLKYADAVCIGEGEIALGELVDKLKGGREDYRRTRSLWFRQGDGIIRNEISPPVEDLDCLGFPDYDLETHYIKKGNRIVPMTVPLLQQNTPLINLPIDTYVTITTRGCPHSCAYCTVPALRRILPGSKRHRRRSVEHVIQELLQMKENHPYFRGVKFNDDNFVAVPSNYMHQLLTRYKKEINLPLHVYGVEPVSLNEDKMAALIDAGLATIRVGIQTGSEKTQLLYNRNFSRSSMLNTAHLINRFTLQLKKPPYYDIILDNPWESESDIVETLQLLLEFPKPYRLALSSLTFFTGTELTERGLKEGYISQEDDNFKPLQRTYINSLFLLLRARWFPKTIVRFLSREGVRRSSALAWFPRLVFNCFFLGNFISWVLRDLRYSDLSRFKKYSRRFLMRFKHRQVKIT